MSDHASAPHRLDQIASLLLEAAVDAPPTALGVVLTDTEVQLHSMPLVDVDELLGFSAPRLWDAFGICASGTGRHLDEIADLPSSRPGLPDGLDTTTGPDSGWRVSVVHLVHRHGHVASMIRRAGDGPRLRPDGATGRVPDLCLRALGLPTPPPAAPVEALWTAWWFERILAARLAADLDRPDLSWDQVVRCHPALLGHDEPLIWGDDPGGRSAPRAAFPQRGWSELRHRVADGRLTFPDITPSQARWLDDGSFSRRAFGVLPRSDHLIADLVELLPESVVGRLRSIAGMCSHG